MKSDTPQKGLNIVRKIYTGYTETSKIIFE